MTDFQSLQSRLKSKPYLVADGTAGEVSLVNQTRAFRLMNESGVFTSLVIMDAYQALQNFAKLTGEANREYTLKEIKTIAGVAYSQSFNWLMEGVIVPSIRGRSGSGRGNYVLFSWADAYAAGVIGNLRRQGVRLELLKKIQPLLAEKKTKNKKRTTRKLATSTRP